MSMTVKEKIEEYSRVFEILNESTEDFLFIHDVKKNQNRFFGNIDAHYAIREPGSLTNTLEEMYRVVHPADLPLLVEDLARVERGEQDQHNLNYRWINKDGKTVWISCRGKVIRSEAGEAEILIGRVSEETLRHLYNPLTAVGNKVKFREDSEVILKSQRCFAMLIDIDGLAAINLHYGRAFGDSILKETAERLESYPRVKRVYHVDHNNFLAVVSARTESEVESVFSKLSDDMNDKCGYRCGALPISRRLFSSADDLMDAANMTLMRAKDSDEDILFFSSDQTVERLEAFALLEELYQSAEGDFSDFSLVYQPIFKKDGTLASLEALLRYNSPTRGRVMPGEFIPLLESSKLIRKVGAWVLRTALTDLKEWRKTLPELTVSVNFSSVQLEDSHIADQVMRILEDVGVPASALTVEFTESRSLVNNDRLKSTLHYLKTAGVKYSLDDFGTGYSNVAYLATLEIDEIKIDRSFVSGITPGSYNYELVSSVSRFAKTAGIKVVAEGIETEEELKLLRDLGIDLYQGFLLERPISVEDLTRKYLA